MSFVTELPTFDCICGAPAIPAGKAGTKAEGYKAYMERYATFRPTFHGMKQGSVKDLEVVFGGFSPTVMGGNDLAEGYELSGRVHKDRGAEEKYFDESKRFQAEYFAAKKHAEELESARASEPRVLEEGGVRWTYVLLDDAEVRIEHCETGELSVCVPSAIEGKPVVAIAPDGMANLASVEEIVCADGIQSIGGCAFRGCRRLRRLVLPKQVPSFESSWFRHCSKVEELVLPGNLQTVKADVFDNAPLKRLVIGQGTQEIEPGAFGRSTLESIDVVDENPLLASDGKAVYTKDGGWLLALAVPVERYQVRAGCRALAKRCMSAFRQLKEVELPRTVEFIAEFAFYNTQITTFNAPCELGIIGEKAFFRCTALQQAHLNEGLRIVEASAFAGTGLTELVIPTTAYHLGEGLAQGSKLVYSGPEATLRMAGEGEFLSIDSYGALYRKEEDGTHLVALLDDAIEELQVREGTRCIDAEACARHKALRHVTLPEGLEELRQGAFRASRELAHCLIPDSVRVIGPEAFFDTSLEEVHIPAALESLGESAFITYYAHAGQGVPSVREVSVAPAQRQRYRMESSLLIETAADGGERVLLTDCSEENMVIPRSVTAIAPYALQGNNSVLSLTLWTSIREVGVRGLAIESFVRHLRINAVQPIEGHDFFELDFPDTPRAVKQLAMGLCMMTSIDIPMLYKYYDTVVCNSAGFGKDNGGLKLHEQVARMLKRLEDPVFMTESLHSTLVSYLHNNILDVCEALAKADDRRSIDRLIDLGYITCENLTACIDRIGTVKDAAMTGYLLEVKRRRFGRVSMDFEL